MIKRFLKGLDQKYLKICMYAAITVLVTVIAGALAFSTGPFWSKLWAIFTAVLKPIVIGGIICYLLLPAVNRLERLFNRDKEHGWARPASVFLTFAIIAAALILRFYNEPIHNSEGRICGSREVSGADDGIL